MPCDSGAQCAQRRLLQGCKKKQKLLQLPPLSLFHSPLPRSRECLHVQISALPSASLMMRTGREILTEGVTRSCRTFGWEGGLIVTLVGLLLCCDSTCSVGVPSACTSEKVNPPLGGRTPAYVVCTRQKTPKRSAGRYPLEGKRGFHIRRYSQYI